MRPFVYAAGLLAALPVSADDGVYRCLAESTSYWTGARTGQVETLPPGEYEIALDTGAKGDESGRWAETPGTGARFRLDFQPGEPDELAATREDNRFSLRIDLGATPMRFAGIGADSLLTGTCFFEPRTTK